jgi:hypothetical protein
MSRYDPSLKLYELEQVILRALPSGHFYHYTRNSGFLGIVGSRSLFATQIQYQNDGREWRIGLKRLRKAAGPEPHDHPTRLLLSALAGPSVSTTNIFVCSLTTRGDLLSQWRGYCGPGDGLSVGFSPDAIQHMARQYGWALGPVLYDKERQLKVARLIVESVRQRWNDAQERGEPDARADESAVGAFRFHLERYLPFIKHRSFREEREWRLVSPVQPFQSFSWDPLGKPSPSIEHRAGSYTLLPYLRFQLVEPSQPQWGEPEGSYQQLGLRKVIVGPGPHMRLAVRAVRGFLDEWRVDAEVAPSRVSFRDW